MFSKNSSKERGKYSRPYPKTLNLDASFFKNLFLEIALLSYYTSHGEIMMIKSS